MTALHVSLPLGLPGEQGRRKATEKRNILPHMRRVSPKTQGWSRLRALTMLMLEYFHPAHFASTFHLSELAFGEALWMSQPLTGCLPDGDPVNLTSHQESAGCVPVRSWEVQAASAPQRMIPLGYSWDHAAAPRRLQVWGEAARTHSNCWQAL